MMKEYPDYERGELNKKYEEIKGEERKVLDDFLLSCRTSANELKVRDMLRSIVQFRDITGEPLTGITLTGLRNWLVLLNQSNREDWTRHGLKVHIKKFIKFVYPDWTTRFNNLRELKAHTPEINQKKINEKTLLKKEEIETIMNKENDMVLKAFFITLYESGMRPSELRKLKWENIEFNAK